MKPAPYGSEQEAEHLLDQPESVVSSSLRSGYRPDGLENPLLRAHGRKGESMSNNREYRRTLAIVGLLASGTLFAGSGENRVERPSRDEIVQNSYSGSEEVQPPMAPPTSYQEEIIDLKRERGNLND
jgi:hypothetical protein